MNLSGCIRILLVGYLCFLPITGYSASNAAVFAAGCFWCAEHDFEQVPGVTSVVSGYAGGKYKNPSYQEVSRGNSGYVESVKVVYDPQLISYDKLLNHFWRFVDPTDDGGQFCDRGEQYRSVIFYGDSSEKNSALKSRDELIKSGRFKTIATQILPLTTFYPAETYHQGYAHKNPIRYNYYRYTCGRDKRLSEVWGDAH